jgi:hypothetical protein
MSNFKPSFTIPKRHHDYWDKKPYHVFVFPTYRELKRKLVGIMKEHGVSEVCVSRSLRGEWGERFEYWHLHGDKLTKGKEGWM